MKELKKCPICGQGIHKVVEGARCIVCGHIVPDTPNKCKHLEDGMSKCTTCTDPTWESIEGNRMGKKDYEGLTH